MEPPPGPRILAKGPRVDWLTCRARGGGANPSGITGSPPSGGSPSEPSEILLLFPSNASRARPVGRLDSERRAVQRSTTLCCRKKRVIYRPFHLRSEERRVGKECRSR